MLKKIYRSQRDRDATINAINVAVHLMRWEVNFDDKSNCHYSGPREVPFIAQYY